MKSKRAIILLLKYSLEEIIGFGLKIFSIFPICSRRIVFSAYSGKQFSCNPKYIFLQLERAFPGKYEIIWAFQKPEAFAFLKKRNVRLVKYKSARYLYYVLTSKFYVDNVEPWSILRFRKGQCVMNTWHGGGTFKQVGSDRADVLLPEKRHVIDKMARTTVFVSGSRAFSNLTIRGSFRYRGKILECGMPRNAYLLANQNNSTEMLAIRNKLEILPGQRILLVAPTFRNSGQVPTESIDLKRTIKALAGKFGGEWVVLTRGHYYSGKNCLSGAEKDLSVRDVTGYPDMQELLLASDVLITDYSSSMWDFSLLYKPVFLYTPDLKAYQKERTFYWPIEAWPYPCASENASFVRKIQEFDLNKYRSDLDDYFGRTGSCEGSEAASVICRWIDQQA